MQIIFPLSNNASLRIYANNAHEYPNQKPLDAQGFRVIFYSETDSPSAFCSGALTQTFRDGHEIITIVSPTSSGNFTLVHNHKSFTIKWYENPYGFLVVDPFGHKALFDFLYLWTYLN